MPPLIRFLILANAIIFLGGEYAPGLTATFALWPPGSYTVPEFSGRVGFEPWQLVTYAFLHAGFAHLFFNMFGLYMFGRDVELAAGSRRFATLYFASVLAAGLTQLAVVSMSPLSPRAARAPSKAAWVSTRAWLAITRSARREPRIAFSMKQAL